jgi:hypothetical protein
LVDRSGRGDVFAVYRSAQSASCALPLVSVFDEN